jgi:hypothetical protein
MADLEEAADVALVKIKELSSQIERAEAAFTAVEEKLDDVKEQFEADWSALDEKARAVLEVARAQTAGIAQEGEDARQSLTGLDDSLTGAVSEWDGAIEAGGSETTQFGVHVSEKEPVVSEAGTDTEAAARKLAERVAAIEAQLQEAMAEARDLLEREVAGELKEMQGAVRERASALQAAVADECGTILDEAFTSWQERLAHVEEVIDQEFAKARDHAAAVVAFSLEECQKGHEETWEELSSLTVNLEGLLQKLGEAVRARTAEMGDRRTAAEQALSETAAGVERVRSTLALELEMMARYEFVS